MYKRQELANQEAQRFNHEYISTEHILLGLIKEGCGVAANVLKILGLDLRKVRLEVEKLVYAGPDLITLGRLPRTPRTMRVLELADEARRELQHHTIGTEHILLGLIRAPGGIVDEVFHTLHVTPDAVKSTILQMLGLPEKPPVSNPQLVVGFAIVHEQTGLTLRQWVKTGAPVKVHYDGFEKQLTFRDEKIRYLLGGGGRPCFYYEVPYEGAAIWWLDTREWKIAWKASKTTFVEE